MRVLLVEDEPETAKLLAKGLSEASYSVDVALNGMDGRRFIESGEYELIILDVMLPGLNGWQLLQQIRKLGDTPVLFLPPRTASRIACAIWSCMRMITCSSRLP